MAKWANLILKPVSNLVSMYRRRADRKQQLSLAKRLKRQSIPTRATDEEQRLEKAPQRERVE